MTKHSPEDYADYRLKRANETLKEVEVLIENKLQLTGNIMLAFMPLVHCSPGKALRLQAIQE